jgi:peroxiredoxin
MVECAGKWVLIDCGIFQGSRELDEILCILQVPVWKLMVCRAAHRFINKPSTKYVEIQIYNCFSSGIAVACNRFCNADVHNGCPTPLKML